MSEPAPNPPKSHDEAVDVYCLKCGYNLRGLSGDPRRCPECFSVNWIGDFEVPAELVKRQLRRMESAATTCVACILSIVGIVFWPPFSDFFRGYRDLHRSDCCSPILLVMLPFIWGLAASSYLKACSYNPAGPRVLLRYHVYGIALSAVVIGIVALGAWLIDYLVTPREVGPPDEGLRLVYTAILGIAVTLGIVRFFPPLHRRATKRLNEVQYEAAVSAVRDRLRREISLQTPEPPLRPD